MLHCCHIVLYKQILDQKRPVCCNNDVTEKPTVGSTFFGAFPSDRVPRATKNVDMYFCIYSNNFCKLYQRISETF